VTEKVGENARRAADPGDNLVGDRDLMRHIRKVYLSTMDVVLTSPQTGK